jgi:hypothetical protein
MQGQPAEIVFADGERAGFERRVDGVRPVPFEWREPVTPTRAMLSSFAGRYISDELGGAVYRIAATDSTLELRTGTSDPIVGRAVFANTFLADGNTIQFTETKGRVTGFEVTNSRMRRVKFTRMP